MSTVEYSNLAEIELWDEWLDSDEFCAWLAREATFTHADSFEYIHHLFSDEKEDFFIKDRLIEVIPPALKDLILEARRGGAVRVCFYK